MSGFSWNLPSQSVVRLEDDEMATLLQQSPYRCDQCGTTDIVAAPVVYQQGTRTHSGMFRWGSSQTHSAQLAVPPLPKSFWRPLLHWAFPICFCFFWGLAVLSTMLQRTQITTKTQTADALLLLAGVLCLGGLIRSIRRIVRYNREVYPKQRWDWEHTYMCRRCGSRLLISS